MTKDLFAQFELGRSELNVHPRPSPGFCPQHSGTPTLHRPDLTASLDRFLADAAAAGCPRDQVENFLRAGLILQPRQLAASAAARRCDLPDGPTAIGYGGARGGGKSHWLVAQLGADDCQRVPGLKCLLLRKVGKSNRENFADLRLRVLRKLPHSFAESRGLLTFANGSRIICGHFQNETDIDAYLGLEYDLIGIEEATTLSARKYQDITTCCRSSKTWTPVATCAPRPSDSQHSTLNSQLPVLWRPRIYSTTNPGGVGHAWYRKLFIQPFLDRSQLSTLNSQLLHQPSTIFIPARVTDNQFTNPGYLKILQNLTGWKRRAWLDGDWDIAAGQFFTTFRRDVHVIHDFDDGRGVQWFAAMDYGFTHYTVVLLGCQDADGRIFIVDEHAQRLWLPERHALAIRAMFARHHLSDSQLSTLNPQLLQRFVAGPDVFSRQSDGTTIAQQYARLGFPLRPANPDRINGWGEILHLLGDPAAGFPARLFIHQRCARLIACLPSLQHDPLRPEDVLKVDPDEEGLGGDDAADCLRYLVSTRARVLIQRKLTGL